VAAKPRRRLRSASVQLGALTALALTLTACNNVGDDDDDGYCGRGAQPQPTIKERLTATAPLVPASIGLVPAALGADRPDPALTPPSTGGFGTHLARCGG
jgi:hypothetical protein